MVVPCCGCEVISNDQSRCSQVEADAAAGTFAAGAGDPGVDRADLLGGHAVTGVFDDHRGRLLQTDDDPAAVAALDGVTQQVADRGLHDR